MTDIWFEVGIWFGRGLIALAILYFIILHYKKRRN